MDGVQRPDRFRWERSPRALDDLLVECQQCPSLRHSIQSCLPVNGIRFLKLVEHDRANQYPIAFDHGQIGCDDKFGLRQRLRHELTMFLLQEPGKRRT